MEKFLKSIFHPDKKRSSKTEAVSSADDFVPPIEDRRKLSISRSGRMRQANKKRHSLTVDLYGENLQMAEKPAAKEYHVNKPIQQDKTKDFTRAQSDYARRSSDVKTPEEEIDKAFEIIDKS